MSVIPIRNLYLLLCYAWDRLDEAEILSVGSIQPPSDALNLVARVLTTALSALIRRGFERGYHEVVQEYPGIRGRLVIEHTIRRSLPRRGLALCAFDELDHDTLANRLIKSVLLRLRRSGCLDAHNIESVSLILRYFKNVQTVPLQTSDLARIQIHRNNQHYAFALQICHFVLTAMLPDEAASGFAFSDFTRNEKAMARLFEAFVRNFYTTHAEECGLLRVSRPKIQWDGIPFDDNSYSVWPEMNTDVCLEREDWRMIVDCKFYKQAFQHHWDKKSLIQGHLFQLYSYVQNMSAAVPDDVEGVLLYPEVNEAMEFGYTVGGKVLRVVSLNLADEWPSLHKRLLAICRPRTVRGAAR
jgi:5-methylcytosine-specific restriction enzyme subunit McrC